MSEAVVDDIVAVLPPLLQSLETLAHVARHLHPPEFGRVMHEIGTPEEALQAARVQLGEWPENFAAVRTSLDAASDAALSAFAGLRDVQRGNGDFVAVIRALRHVPRAQEALYPLAVKFPPVSDFFLDPALHANEDIKAKLAQPETSVTGLIHGDSKPGSRGSFSLYVPEYYTPDRAWPLVVALHGGSGNGRNFLWTWLRDARSFGAILIAPTATGPTWALMGEDNDTPNLDHILGSVRNRWNVDSNRMLLTGMSDGGTFCYVTGLERTSPFTHLAPSRRPFTR